MDGVSGPWNCEVLGLSVQVTHTAVGLRCLACLDLSPKPVGICYPPREILLLPSCGRAGSTLAGRPLVKTKPRGLLAPVHRHLVQVETSLVCPPSSLPLLAARRARPRESQGQEDMWGTRWVGHGRAHSWAPPSSRCQPHPDPVSLLPTPCRHACAAGT